MFPILTLEYMCATLPMCRPCVKGSGARLIDVTCITMDACASACVREKLLLRGGCNGDYAVKIISNGYTVV